jgi:hypothetical protein
LPVIGSPPQQSDDGEMPQDAATPAETRLAALPYVFFTASVMLFGVATFSLLELDHDMNYMRLGEYSL